MRRIASQCLVVALLLSPLLPGHGVAADAPVLRDPMQPPPLALRKFRQARLAGQPKVETPVISAPPPAPMQLTSIIYSAQRKIAIIDDQMLALGDRIRGAKLVGLTRESARLLRNGKVINLSLGVVEMVIRKKVVESDL